MFVSFLIFIIFMCLYLFVGVIDIALQGRMSDGEKIFRLVVRSVALIWSVAMLILLCMRG